MYRVPSLQSSSISHSTTRSNELSCAKYSARATGTEACRKTAGPPCLWLRGWSRGPRGHAPGARTVLTSVTSVCSTPTTGNSDPVLWMVDDGVVESDTMQVKYKNTCYTLPQLKMFLATFCSRLQEKLVLGLGLLAGAPVSKPASGACTACSTAGRGVRDGRLLLHSLRCQRRIPCLHSWKYMRKDGLKCVAPHGQRLQIHTIWEVSYNL